MSQSPSYQRDTASASPEILKEGDFLPRHLYDNLRSPEEKETCDDHKDPLVNITTDDYAGSPLNAQVCAPPAAKDLGKLCAGALIEKTRPVSPELMEALALDGGFITLVGAQTQTDWEWVEQRIAFGCQAQKESGDPELLQAEGMEPCDETMAEAPYEIPRVGPPRLIAYKPEPKRAPHVEQAPEVESEQGLLLAHFYCCQQLRQPLAQSQVLENPTDLTCVSQATQIRALIQEEKEKSAQKESDRKIDVSPHAPVMSDEEREAAEANESLRDSQLQRKLTKDNANSSSRNEIKKKTSKSLSKESPQVNDEWHIPILQKMTDWFIHNEETDGEPKRFYKSGTCFITLCPDGTGNVFYPSGKAAIIVSSAGAADFTYVILEDKDVATGIKGIFTNKGHATCYHPNGTIRVNVTPAGGLCFSETGALCRRWNWLYRCDSRVRNLPFKPLTFALGPHVAVRIHSQERMYISFTHRQNRVNFNVGSKLKLLHPGSYEKLGQDALKRYIQMKSLEMYSLLDQMQTCVSHHSSSLSNIKPHYRFIAQTQRLSWRMEKDKSSEKIKAHVN
ncbi:glutamate-rich protein 6 [Pungitius pungitius]|uniref:glutamate-rich protein 6 n=1 Tax=Pungitius pungitius TaxID=134920 RepID=UPI002E0F9467